VLTCYDASFATLLENTGVEVLLVGDSLAWWCRARKHPAGEHGRHGLPHPLRRARGKASLYRRRHAPSAATSRPGPGHAQCREADGSGAQMVKLEAARRWRRRWPSWSSAGFLFAATSALHHSRCTSLVAYKVQGKGDARRRS